MSNDLELLLGEIDDNQLDAWRSFFELQASRWPNDPGARLWAFMGSAVVVEQARRVPIPDGVTRALEDQFAERGCLVDELDQADRDAIDEQLRRDREGFGD
jgi:hypothetical protein